MSAAQGADRAHLLNLLSATLPPSIVNPGATVTAMRAAQWSWDTAKPTDPDEDDGELETAITDRPVPKPLLDAAAVIAEAEALGHAWVERMGCEDRYRLAYETGVLRAKLKAAAYLIEDLRRELQTACDETCNGYHKAGHFERVQRLYGITEAVEA